MDICTVGFLIINEYITIYKHTVINPRIFGVPDGVYFQLGPEG